MSRNRLAVPILVILFLLLAGVAFAFLGPLKLSLFANKSTTTEQEESAARESAKTEKPSKPDIASGTMSASEDGNASFDIARIDREGTSVLAGRADPGSSVTILEDEQAIGTVQADEHGEWSFATEHKFASNDPNLALTTKPTPPPVQTAEAKPQEAAGSGETSAAPQEQAGVSDTEAAPKEAPAKAALAQGAAPKAEPEERSAKTATARMMQNLEDMVASARKEATNEAASPAKEALTTPTEPEQPTEEPLVAAEAPASELVDSSTSNETAAVDNKTVTTSDSVVVETSEDNETVDIAAAEQTTDETSGTPSTSNDQASTASRLVGSSETTKKTSDTAASTRSGETRYATAAATATPSSAQPVPPKTDQAETSTMAAETKQETPAPTARADVTMAAVSPPAKPASAQNKAERKSIPVPITFVFNESTFTDQGQKAVALLNEYLTLKRYANVSLTGHADERGSEQLNMDLSRERLEAVATYLKNHGYSGDLELIPKGESEPYEGVDRSEYPREELYQLDRRVELLLDP